MSLKLRLARAGTKKRPYYHIVVADARSPRDGRFIERIGTYSPLIHDADKRVTLLTERATHWLGVGAQPTDRVLRFLDAAGVMKREPRNNPDKGKPGKKATERVEANAKAAEDKIAADAKAVEDKKAADAAAAEAAAAAAAAPAEEAPAEEAPAEDAAPAADDSAPKAE